MGDGKSKNTMDQYVIPPVVSDHPKVHELVGRNWIERRVEAALDSAKRKQHLHPSTMSPACGWIVHPLLAEAKQKGRTPISDSLELDLRDLDDVPLPQNLGKRLRDDHDFHKATYEIRIAAGFRRLGFRPVWCSTMKQRRPEFLVLMGGREIMSVECKKRDVQDGYEKDAGVFWKHLQYQLRQRMSAHSLNYWVKVSGAKFEIADVNVLVLEIISSIRQRDCGQFNAVHGRYRVEYLRLTEPNGSVIAEVIDMFPRGHMGINAGQLSRSMVGSIKNPKLLRMELIDDPQRRLKGIVRNLKNAAKQMIHGLPYLVYLDVNIPNFEQERAEFDGLAEAISHELHMRYRHVSAVILTNIYPALSLNGYLGWRVRTECVLQPKPTAPILRELVFPGDMPGTAWLPGPQASL